MQKIIHNLRQKPDHHKKAISLGLSFVITAFIFGIWLVNKVGIDNTVIVYSDAGALGPIASVWNGFISIFR